MAATPATMRAVQYDAYGGGAAGLKVRRGSHPLFFSLSFFFPLNNTGARLVGAGAKDAL